MKAFMKAMKGWAVMKAAFHEGMNAAARVKGAFMLGVNNSPLMKPPLSSFMKAKFSSVQFNPYMNPWPWRRGQFIDVYESGQNTSIIPIGIIDAFCLYR